MMYEKPTKKCTYCNNVYPLIIKDGLIMCLECLKKSSKCRDFNKVKTFKFPKLCNKCGIKFNANKENIRYCEKCREELLINKI